MKFLKKWLYDAVTSYGQNERTGTVSTALDSCDNGINELEHITLTIAPARGGLVINSRFYDRQKDRSISTAYVIHEGDNTAEEISKIITMEMVRM
jgi:hypothetical protein